MNKVIHMYYINKIKIAKFKIFEAEDDDYPDLKTIKANEKAIEHYLEKANIKDNKLREELLYNIQWTNDNCVRRLEELGWTIITDKEVIQAEIAEMWENIKLVD